jgi:hypothetical protein
MHRSLPGKDRPTNEPIIARVGEWWGGRRRQRSAADAGLAAFRTTLLACGFLALIGLASAADVAQLRLDWVDNSSNEKGFRIWRKAETEDTYTEIAARESNATSYVDTTVTAGVTYCYQVRAYNDAGESAPSNEACATAGTASSRYTVWSDAAMPVNPNIAEATPVELGVKFRANVTGYITGIRFYKGPTNTGTHVGSLWSRTGALLRQATFTNETESGWQQATFAKPVAITANTTYVASYHTTAGHYAGDNDYFATTGVTNGPLTALAAGVDGSNGVYRYSATSAFPNQSYRSSNYWVDVMFAASAPGTPTRLLPPAPKPPIPSP